MALEKITDAQMDANGVIAAPDILSGSPAANKAIFDRMVRNLVAPAYNACVDVVNAIQEMESGMQSNENKRQDAEAERTKAELERVAKELLRVTAESERILKENERMEAESERKTAEQEREQAEQSRVSETGGIVARATEQANLAEMAKTKAEEAQAAAERARDEAQEIAGGEFASQNYVDLKAAEAEENSIEYTNEQIAIIGDLVGAVQETANNAQAAADSKAPMYTYGTDDLEAGVTPLETGKLHFVYE